jgi:prepilin-type N-terminal cleavage/methylation domain-containing protein
MKGKTTIALRAAPRRKGPRTELFNRPSPLASAVSLRRAFTLIEMLVYIAILTILMGLGYEVLFQSLASSLVFHRSADDIVKILRAGEQWRSDVRACREVRPENNPGEQLLHLYGARDEVSYRFATNCLFRSVARQKWTPILVNVKTATFAPDRRQMVTAWRWELELQRRAREPGIARPLFTFIAVPTGSAPQ